MTNQEKLEMYGAQNIEKTKIQYNMYWIPLGVCTRLLSLRSLLNIRATNHATARIVSSDNVLSSERYISFVDVTGNNKKIISSLQSVIV